MNQLFIPFIPVKRILLLFFALLLTIVKAECQYYTNQNKVWAFGTHAGLNFTSGSPVAFYSAINTAEGSASICDGRGNLLFYTNGENVYNRLGSLMPHGSYFVPYLTSSTTQAAVITPVPGSANQYYLFSLENISSSGLGRLTYSIVDMTLDGGNGDLVTGSIGIPLASNLSEQLTAIAGNSCNIWLLTHRRDSAIYMAYNITNSGISGPVISRVGSFRGHGMTIVKGRPDRLKIVSTVGVELNDFDPATGVVSNNQVLNPASNFNYGAEFSPDNTKLYISRYGVGIYQYDLSLSSTSAIIASATLVASGNFSDLKLAPDGKIYFGALSSNIIDCISTPNGTGSACGYTSAVTTLSAGTNIIFGLPNIVITVFPNDTLFSRHDTTICFTGVVTIRAHDTGYSYLWDDGSSGATRTITSGGVYRVRIYNGCGLKTDTIHVDTLDKTITGNRNVCFGGTTLLSNSTPGGTWSSSATSIASVNSATGLVSGVATGTATITYQIPAGCFATVTVTVNANPVVTGIASLCVAATTGLASSSVGGVWSSGSSGIASIDSASGIVTGVSPGSVLISYTLPNTCYTTKIVTVNPPPTAISLNHICEGARVTLYSFPGGGIWSSGSLAVAAIGSATGAILGVSAGTSAIRYTLPTGCYITTMMTVDPSPGVISGSSVVCVGMTDTFRFAVPGGYWTSSAFAIADVDAGSGVLIGVSLGSAIITYNLSGGGCYVTKAVTVSSGPSIIVGAGTACVSANATLINGVSGGTWSSSATTTATINPTSGTYTGIATGTAVITYSLGPGCITTRTITITPSPAPIVGTLQLCPGGSTTLTDATPGGRWSAASASILSISSSTGMVVGGFAGTTTITYTAAGCSATVPFTVNPLPAAITGMFTACPATTTTLSSASTGGTWSSGTTTIATIGSATGTATGAAAGVTTITYTLPTACYTTKQLTVQPNPTAILGASTVCVGASTTLTNGTARGSWSRSNSNVSIGSFTGVVTGVTAGTTTITYTLPTGCYATKVLTVSSTGGSIGGSFSVCIGGATPLTASGIGTWSSSNPAVATVGSSGIVSGISAGTATITFSGGSCNALAPVTVNSLPSVFSVTGGGGYCAGGTGMHVGLGGSVSGVSYQLYASGIATGLPVMGTGGSLDFGLQTAAGVYTVKGTGVTGCTGNMSGSATVSLLPVPVISGPSAVCVGSTMTATALPSGGGWLSSTPSVATVSSGGVVSGVTTGTATLTYSLATGCMSTKMVTVSTSPTAITGASSVCTGDTVTLSNGVGGGWWTSSTTAVSVGAADGVIRGVGSGVVTVSYSLGSGCTVMRTMTVHAAPAAITGGGSVCAGSTLALADVTPGGIWSSSNAAVATIGSASGVVYGLTIGSTIITYTLPTTCSITTTINVSTAPSAITGAGTVCAGSGSTGLTMTTLASTPTGGLWSSSNTARATVNSTTGEVTGTGAGTVNITYSLGTGCTVTKAMTVLASPATITGPGSLCSGSSISLTTATTGGTWSSSAGSVTIGGSGPSVTVNGITAGTAVISYSVSGCSTIRTITVNPSPAAIGGPTAVCMGASATETNTVAGGVWSTTSANINIGSTGVVSGVASGTAVVTYALGTCSVTRTMTVNATLGISGAGGLCMGASATLSAGAGTWGSGAAGTATVGAATGLVTGINAGVAPITFTTTAGCSSVKMVTVYAVPAAISGTAAVCVGGTAALTTATGGGTWSSAATGTATVNSSSGMVTGVNAGVATISYSLGTGCATTRQVTVNALPAVITGTAVLCIGNATTLSSGTSGGVWSSDNTAVAGIGSATGIVSGAGTGTAMISYTNPVTGCAATKVVTVTSLPAPISGAGGVCLNDSITLSNTTAGGAWSSSNPVLASVGSASGVVSGLVTGSVMITYSLGAGCEVSKVITVNPLPAGITGARNVCTGATTTLATTAAGGVWSSGTATATVGSATGAVTGAAGGPATISYTIPTGCAATYTMSVIAVPAIDNIHSVCAWGDTIMIHNANPSGTYSSTSVTVTNLGGGDAIVTGFAPGTGTVTYTLTGLGCATVSTVTVNPLPMAISGVMNICRGSTTTLSDLTPGGVWSSSNTAVAAIGSTSGVMSALAGGTSIIAYTLATGCKEDTVITVSIPPVAGTIIGADSWCAGTTGTLTATGGMSGGVWGSSNAVVATVGGSAGLTITVNPLAAGTSTIGYMVSNVCGTDVADKVITVNATPTAGVIEGTDSVCVGAIVMLTDTASGGVWSVAIGNAVVGSATGKVSGIGGGMDTVYYTVSNGGCTARAMLPVRVIPLSECRALGVAGSEPNGIRIYPNPNGGKFTTALPVHTAGHITVTDVYGRVVYDAESDGRRVLPVALSVAPGIYYVTATIPGMQGRPAKVVVQ